MSIYYSDTGWSCCFIHYSKCRRRRDQVPILVHANVPVATYVSSVCYWHGHGLVLTWLLKISEEILIMEEEWSIKTLYVKRYVNFIRIREYCNLHGLWKG